MTGSGFLVTGCVVIIVLAFLAVLFLTYRIWRLQKSIEDARTRVDLLPQVIWEKGATLAHPVLRVTSASPVIVGIYAVEISAWLVEKKRSSRHRFERGYVSVAPYSTAQINLDEVLEPICQELSQEEQSIPVKFQVIVHHTAFGLRGSSASSMYTGLLFDGKLVWTEAVGSLDVPNYLTFGETGIPP